MIGRSIEPDIAERSRLRMAQAAAQPQGVKSLPATSVTSRTTDEVAALVGIGSGRTYERGKRVLLRVEHAAPQDRLT